MEHICEIADEVNANILRCEQNKISREDAREAIGDILKECRNKSKLHIKDVAAQLGISVGTISNWEKGKSVPNLESLRQILRLYEIDIKAFIGVLYEDYEKDRKVFARYGLPDAFFQKLFLDRMSPQKNDMLTCLNLLCGDAMHAEQLVHQVIRFFDADLHARLEAFQEPRLTDDISRFLIEPVVQTLCEMYNRKHPDEQLRRLKQLSEKTEQLARKQRQDRDDVLQKTGKDLFDKKTVAELLAEAERQYEEKNRKATEDEEARKIQADKEKLGEKLDM